uniref:Corazonin n=9 Tax=Neoptera TaxID=33340 RepID=CORZ_RHOPR|nr:RecName: Full=Corazonin [Striatophasma naukluftense]B0M3E3.1 RecName: Full=Corazonin [Mantophasma kudubergense]B3A0H2.1 RecName: Full=Corazonin [Praedatophasma maraisi]B3A0J2.1 RecName: Full=Corazonin [Tyrannophasma gladiator]B3A0L1.1 RecName: Full=Corazonin [Pachyphasma brandbergense]B3EWM1.1 RecName: Full=Corazonin; Contains: RecName: Full=Corazonin(3-11) [Delia radicum]P11496.2 RecName: Full=Corazonin [Periplaneta americana]P85812.1 RecName: Full=Corazonin; Short=Rhopr-Crz [Rhodnius pr
QTFQYSRGWTN